MATTTPAVRIQDEIKTDAGRRNMSRTWHLDDVTAENHGVTHHAGVYLHVADDKDSKVIRISFTRVHISPVMWGMAIDFRNPKPVNDITIPRKRYSDKLLAEAFEQGKKIAELHMDELLAWAPGALEDI